LQQLGIKTIVSVDGARPDVNSARKYGIEYVHIPIGYDGVPNTAAAALTRVVRERPGPYYVHCHHGQHRGPAAAAVMCIAAGAMQNSEAHSILEAAGTSRDYVGLWRDVSAFDPPSRATPLPALQSVAPVESLAATMAHIDRVWDNLKLCKSNGWDDPAKHRDVSGAHESLLLREAFHEAARLQGPRFNTLRTHLSDAEALAGALEADLRAKAKRQADEHFKSLENACNACHSRYRN
jgi:protein tyrosine phosphatase (PTP) superfamily phosphohydrolase (DUF442 family)